MKLSDGLDHAPDGTEYKDGYDCNGKPAKVAVVPLERRRRPDGRRPRCSTSDFGNIRLNEDRGAYHLRRRARGHRGAAPPEASRRSTT